MNERGWQVLVYTTRRCSIKGLGGFKVIIEPQIPYVPKPANERHSSKPHCKSGRQIECNSVPIKACAVDIDIPTQKANRDDGIIVEDMLTQHNL